MRENLGRPQKLLNITTGHEIYDALHKQPQRTGVCTKDVCHGSLMTPVKSSTQPRSKEEVLKLAKEFFDEYFQSIKRQNADQNKLRWENVKNDIEINGTYELTEAELLYGAKLAWRNAPRCIGRIQWTKLKLFDARHVTTARGMFEAICKQIEYGINGGNIRSAITVFPQRTDGKHDYRVWNVQLLAYAGYKNPDGSITGDPINVEFTELCLRLGWKGKRGRFDILPLVLSAQGEDPEWFDVPEEFVVEVELIHPEYKWFKDLDLKWHCFPAVSGLLFDCGGLEFPGAPFNGWYMATEIAARDFCDPQRYNITELVAKKMGLDVSTQRSLWKDKAVIEVNQAVLYSFQQRNITIMDHHTAAESFMKHFEQEHRVRGGCPADWVWIVPPISGSVTPVFHQEMSLYYLKPSYEYQEAAWKIHVWKNKEFAPVQPSNKRETKLKFRNLARAIQCTSQIYAQILSKRIKATILYASETGKSENFAEKLGEIFGHTFNAQVLCMSDYDITNLEHEALVLLVTSTFGNGDPPENGEEFSKHLSAMKEKAKSTGVNGVSNKLHRSVSVMKMNGQLNSAPLNRADSLSGLYQLQDAFGILNNIRYSVFALGSSTYPNFCAHGKYLDKLLYDLGGERLVNVACGDDMAGQEQEFQVWTKKMFESSCETFCINDELAMQEATAELKVDTSVSADKFRLSKVNKEEALTTGLAQFHNRKVTDCTVLSSKNLHGDEASRATQNVVFKTDGSKELEYQPGDHVAILPQNRKEIVNSLVNQLKDLDNPDEPVALMNLKEQNTPDGLANNWEPYRRLPEASVRTLLTRYLDITTPPTPYLLHIMSEHASDHEQMEYLEALSKDPQKYEEWKLLKYPTLPEVLEEYPSVQIETPLLLSQLPILQPRFYSISSSPLVHKNEIHLTVAVVVYRTEDGKGAVHYGVCSNYLKDLQPGEDVQCFIRNASGFHLPIDKKKPIILIGPGTGVAPFRSFWQHYDYLQTHENANLGDMTLFFGCRTRSLDLYKSEKTEMIKKGILKNTYLALSREQNTPKTYVQDLLVILALDVYKQLVLQSGHVYICGDCTMAECVYQTLKSIIQEYAIMNEVQAEKYLKKMRDENRYHEDIFGITLRTGEIHKKTRENVRNKVIFEPTSQTIVFQEKPRRQLKAIVRHFTARIIQRFKLQ